MKLAELYADIVVHSEKFKTGMNTAYTTLNAFDSKLSAVRKSVFNFHTYLIGLAGAGGIGAVAKGFVDTADQFDKMKLTLDTLTKGHGQEWFTKLNEWALKMPVSTKEAVQAFVMMRAMGLKPTIDQMTTLVDTVGAIGGGSEALYGIARAMGQMSAKQKVMQQELNQMAEWGVEALPILQEKFGLTGKELDRMTQRGVTANDAIKALWEGMAEKYGGQSYKIMTTIGGLWELAVSYYTEFQRQAMETGGILDYLKERFGKLKEYLEEAYDTGKLTMWALKFGEKAKEVLKWLEELGTKLAVWVYENKNLIVDIAEGGALIVGLSVLSGALVNVYNAVTSVSTAFTFLAAHPAFAAIMVAGASLGVIMSNFNSSMKSMEESFKSPAIEKAKELASLMERGAKYGLTKEQVATSGINIETGAIWAPDPGSKNPPPGGGERNYNAMRFRGMGVSGDITTRSTAYSSAIVGGTLPINTTLNPVDQAFNEYMERLKKDNPYFGLKALEENSKRDINRISEELAKGTEIWRNSLRDFGNSAADILGDTFFDVIQGRVESLKDLWGSLAESFQRSLTRGLMQYILFGGSTTSEQKEGGGGGIFGALFGSIFKSAEGGVFKKPSITSVAESGAEAVIPLKAGRVPVQLSGGGGASVQHHFHMEGSTFLDQAVLVQAMRNVALNAVVDDYKGNGVMRDIM